MTRSITRRKNGTRRKGVTTIEIAIMIFIAALAALAIYYIASYVLDTGGEQVKEVMEQDVPDIGGIPKN